MIRINLLPSAHRRRKTADPVPFVIAGLIAVLVLVGGGLYFWQTYSIGKLEKEQQSLQQLLADYGKQKMKVDELKRKLAELQTQLDVKNEIMKDALDIPGLIAEISAFTPTDVKITSLTFGGGAVNMSLITTSYSSAANALVSYEEAPSLENVETSSVSKSDDSVNFAILCKLITGGGGSDGANANK